METEQRSGHVQLEVLTGSALADALPRLASLRMEVFREWPYLYDGDAAYEERYLADYADAEGGVIVAARAAGVIVGAATGAPMTQQSYEWSEPLSAQGHDLEGIFYCGESVLLREFRGRGIGHAFFDLREDHARSLGLDRSCFCAVIRPSEHPARPADYRSLDPFWRGRGYRPLEGVEAELAWKDIGESDETTKRLRYWMKKL